MKRFMDVLLSHEKKEKREIPSFTRKNSIDAKEAESFRTKHPLHFLLCLPKSYYAEWAATCAQPIPVFGDLLLILDEKKSVNDFGTRWKTKGNPNVRWVRKW